MIQKYHALSDAAAAVDKVLDDIAPALVGVVSEEQIRRVAQVHAHLKLVIVDVWDQRPEGPAIPDR